MAAAVTAVTVNQASCVTAMGSVDQSVLPLASAKHAAMTVAVVPAEHAPTANFASSIPSAILHLTHVSPIVRGNHVDPMVVVATAAIV